MGHGITKTDTVAIVGERGWHGLGKQIEAGKTPREGLILANLNHDVMPMPLFARVPVFNKADGLLDGYEWKEIKTHVANWRMDTDECLGVVGKQFQIISNWDTADFCEALQMVEGSPVHVETVGSINGGRKVWFLLKGEAFEIGGDTVHEYVLVSNGHDGSASFRVTPTSIKTVCANTLHMVIGHNDDVTSSAWSTRHSTNVMDRIEEAKAALKHFGSVKKGFRDMCNTLASKQVKQSDLEEFFVEAYQRDFKAIPTEEEAKKDEKARRSRDKAVSAWGSFSDRFDDEVDKKMGTTAWTMFNAYSGMVQHDQKAHGKDDLNRVERRVQSNLFGLNSKRTTEAFKQALSLTV